MDVPLLDTEEVIGAKVLLVFEYSLTVSDCGKTLCYTNNFCLRFIHFNSTIIMLVFGMLFLYFLNTFMKSHCIILQTIYFIWYMGILEYPCGFSVNNYIKFVLLPQKFSSFTMESMAFLDHSSPRTGASLEVVGDLKLQQRQPLSHKGLDTRYDVSFFSLFF